MKYITLTIIGFMVVLSSCAKTPSDGYKKFYREYRDAPHTITFKIPGGLASFLIDKEDVEAKEFMNNIDDISFFIADNVSKQMLLDLNNYMPESVYKEIMVIRDGSDEVIFFAKEVNNVIEEIIMTVVGDKELVVMAMFGEFTKEDAKKFVKAIKTEDAVNFRM